MKKLMIVSIVILFLILGCYIYLLDRYPGMPIEDIIYYILNGRLFMIGR